MQLCKSDSCQITINALPNEPEPQFIARVSGVLQRSEMLSQDLVGPNDIKLLLSFRSAKYSSAWSRVFWRSVEPVLGMFVANRCGMELGPARLPSGAKESGNAWL
jgi:hypothetical protein